MRLAFVAYKISSIHSGIAISLVQYSKTLRSMGHDVYIICLQIDLVSRRTFELNDIKIVSLTESKVHLYDFRMFTYSKRLAKRMGSLIYKSPLMDLYIVYADEALPLIDHRNNSRWAYIFQGDWSLLNIKESFTKRHPFLFKMLSLSLSSSLINHSRLIKKFDVMAANSHFSASLASFLYNIPITRCVYPPLQDRLLKWNPVPIRDREQYVVAVLRNDYENGVNLISRIAKTMKVKILGGASIPNADNLGFVSEDEFDNVIGRAIAVLSPSNDEYFGRAIVESLGLGTPVLAFDDCGAKEILGGYNCGWLAKDEDSFIDILQRIFEKRYDSSVLHSCRMRALDFSSEKICKGMLRDLILT